MNKKTGLVEEGKLDEIVLKVTKRPNGTLRIQRDFRYCPSLTDPTGAKETDLNYLIQKYKPDELAAYMAARAAHRNEIIGHDFSQEPELDSARNVTYKLKQQFEELPEEIRQKFNGNHVAFYKFLDNPANAEKLIDMGLMTRKQIDKYIEPDKNDDSNDEKKQAHDKKQKSKNNEAPPQS